MEGANGTVEPEAEGPPAPRIRKRDIPTPIIATVAGEFHLILEGGGETRTCVQWLIGSVG